MATNDQSIGDLLKSAIQDAQELVRSEIALAKAELRTEIKRAGAGVAALAAAAVAAIMAVMLALMALAWGIAAGFGWPVWTGFAIMTLLVALIAGVLAYIGRARLASERHMELTVDTLKENMKWMRARTS